MKLIKPLNSLVVDEVIKVYSVNSNSAVSLIPKFRVLKCRAPSSDMKFNIIDTGFDTSGDLIQISFEELQKIKLLKIMSKTQEDRGWYIEQEKYYMRIPSVDVVKYFSNKSGKVWKEKLKLAMYQNIDKDEKIVNCCMCDLIYLPLVTSMQGFNPHRLMFTNTGTGKTTFSHILGRKPVEKPTESGLLGGGKISERTTGELEGTGFLYIDEINTKETMVLTHLLNYMENGIATRLIQGGSVCKGTKTIVLCGNPKTRNELFSYLSFKQIILSIAGDNALDRIGRRIGIVLYGNNFKTIKDRGLLDVKVDNTATEVKAVCNSVMMKYGDKLTKLVKRSIVWFNSSNDEYMNKLRFYSQKSNDKIISEFIKGLMLSEKKVRFQAMKYVVLNNLGDFIKFTSNKFFEKYEDELQSCFRMFFEYNIDSLKLLVKQKESYSYDDFVKIALEDKTVFDINNEELAGLFCVSRKTIWEWKMRFNY